MTQPNPTTLAKAIEAAALSYNVLLAMEFSHPVEMGDAVKIATTATAKAVRVLLWWTRDWLREREGKTGLYHSSDEWEMLIERLNIEKLED